MYEDYMLNYLNYPRENGYEDTYQYEGGYRGDLDEYYPEIYKIVYPMVKKVCYQNNRGFNKEILDNFISDVNNNKNCNIRIYQLEGPENILIQDIEYIAGEKFNICYDYTRRKISKELSYEADEIYTTKIESKQLTSFQKPVTLYNISDEKNNFEFGIY